MRTNQTIFERTLHIVEMVLVIFVSCLSTTNSALSAEERFYKTGIHALPQYFSVSPSGEYLVFDTKQPLGGMRLLNLRTGVVGNVPAENERMWGMGNLSLDGKRMVAVSTGMRYGKVHLDDMKLIIVDLRDWSWQEISRAGDGVKITPFFSPDGEEVYYFKGVARTEGATPAAKYDLYVIHLATRKEERLTDSRFYQATVGDVSSGNKTVFFGRVGGEILGVEVDNSSDLRVRDSGIVAVDIRTKQVRLATQFDLARFVEIYSPKLDGIGRMYFAGITQAPKSPFVFSVFRYDDKSKTPQRLADFSNWSSFDIAKRSGDIYVSDTRDGEVVFRRLAISANQ